RQQIRREAGAHVLGDDAVPVALLAVALRADDVELLLSAGEDVLVQLEGDDVHELAVHRTLGEGGVAGDRLAGNGPLGRLTHGASVRVELRLEVSLLFGLHLHALPEPAVDITAGGKHEGRSQPQRAHHSLSPLTTAVWVAPSAFTASSTFSEAWSASASTLSQYPCVEALRKASHSNTGWYGCGSRLSAKRPNTIENALMSTVSSNMMGTHEGPLRYGRPPTLMA